MKRVLQNVWLRARIEIDEEGVNQIIRKLQCFFTFRHKHAMLDPEVMQFWDFGMDSADGLSSRSIA